MLFKVFPRHRDGIAFVVLARPGVHSSGESRSVPLGGMLRAIVVILLVVALPGVTHRVIGRGRSELLDFLIGQVCVDIQVSQTATTSSNVDVFVGLVGDIFTNKGLASIHGTHLANIQDIIKVPRIEKVPIRKRAVLRAIKGNAQAPQSLVGAICNRLQGVPGETCLTATLSVAPTRLNRARAGRQVGLLLVRLFYDTCLVTHTSNRICGQCWVCPRNHAQGP